MVYLSGHADRPPCSEPRSPNRFGYLLKPFDARELRTAIEMALYKHAMEKRLRESEKRLRGLALLGAVVQQTAEAVLIFDNDNRIIYLNSAFERLTGISPAEALGRTPELFRSDWRDEEYYHILCETVGTGRTWQGRLIYKRKDETLFPVEATITPLRNSEDLVEHTVVTLVDLSRQVQQEELIRHTQKMEAVGHLAGGIAHDFNNMLTVIQMASTMLERYLDPEDPMCTFTEKIQGTIARATCLTKKLLSFSRRDDASVGPTNLNQTVENLSWLLKRLAGSRIRLGIHLEENLLPVRTTASSIEQVIMNLVANARDAMPDGGSLTIETANKVLDGEFAADRKGTGPGPYVMLKVSDTGIGMDDAVRARIFEPFFTTKGRGEGIGLGLSTVQQIVQKAGGYIHVHTEPGQGASFWILLPGQGSGSPSLQHQAPPKLAKTQDRETILIVEDDPIIRELSASQLGSFGYRVYAAASGPEALDLIRQRGQDIDLALVDLVLPCMNGLQLAQELQARQPGLRVLHMSGYGRDVPLVRQALEQSTVFLHKPFDLQTLTAKVQEALAVKNGAPSSRLVESRRPSL